MSIITPVYVLKCFPEVYAPREDTFLLLDALEKDLPFIAELNPQYVVEIGSGSGIVVSALCNVLKGTAICFSTDINPQACEATKLTASLNNSVIEVVNMNLLDNFKVAFDVVLFNPPYVITDASEISGTGLNRSWAGGACGREVLDRVLFNLPMLLSKNGVCYIVILNENNPNEIIKQMQHIGISSDKILERKIPGEHLFVYRFMHSKVII